MILLFEINKYYINEALKVSISNKGQTFLLKKQINNAIF